MKLKILEYNILNGFHTQFEPCLYEPDREKLAVEVVKRENPDILVLCEAHFAFKGKNPKLINYKKVFGFPHCYIGRCDTQKGIAVLSKYPFESEDYSIRKYPFLRTRFDIKGKRFTLDAIHPHPSMNNMSKANFLKSVLRDRNGPHIVSGDFNCVDPKDGYDRKSMVKGFSRFWSNAEEAVENFLSNNVVKNMHEVGFVDTYKAVHKRKDDWHYTLPTDYLSHHKESGIRIDYIFTSKDFKVLDSGIIVNKKTQKASDHFPIYATLEI